MTPKERLLAKLEGLGSTAEVVAKSLAAAGVKGRRQVAGVCPIATYLSDVFFGVRVLPDITIVAGSFAVMNPEQIEEFVRRFDAGEFAELDEDKEDE
jgi:hypothetical protein